MLLGVDTRPELDSLADRGIAQQAALALLGKDASGIFDACFSGRSADGNKPLVVGMQATVPVRRGVPAVATVLSSSPTFAGPLPGFARPAFSYVLLGALRGWVDSDGDKSVTLDEAFGFTRST